MANSGWGDGGYSSSFWGGFQDFDLSISNGVSATVQQGQAEGFSLHIEVLTGQSATGSVGSVLVRIPKIVSVTGIEATGKMTDGWGDGGYGLDAWGGTTSVELVQEVPVTLSAAASGVGSVTVTGVSNVTLSSPAMTASLGTALAGAGAIVSETGLQGDIGFGDESVVGDANVYPTSVSGVGETGNPFVFSLQSFTLTGQELTTALNNDDITVIQSQVIRQTGVQAAGTADPVDITADANLTLTGVSGTGNIGSILIWNQIAPTPTATWNEVAA